MRQAQSIARPRSQPQGDLARRVAAGASVQDMMRRGEIGGQALGLLQMMAGRAGIQEGPRADALGSERTIVGTN